MKRPVEHLELSSHVEAKPLSDWKSVGVELLGCQTRIIQGERWRHRVIECGEGDPLILIHGVGGHAEAYARNMHALGKHFHVYAIDALYHGYSDEGPWDPERRHDYQVDALADLLDAEGHERAHMEGESMGAMLVFEFGLRYPERCGKLIFNTGYGWRVRLQETFDAPAAESSHDDLAALSLKAIIDPDFDTTRRRLEWLMADPDRMTDDMVDIRLRLYSTPEVSAKMRRWFKVDRPTGEDAWDLNILWEEEDLADYKPDSLVFWTEHNPGEPPALGEYFASLIPGCKFYNMLDAAHWPQWEKPEEHDQVLIEFIKGPQV